MMNDEDGKRIETLLRNGKRNPATGIMLALLAEMARSEVEVLRELITSGLAEARRNGVILGRPKRDNPTTRAVYATTQRHRPPFEYGAVDSERGEIARKNVSTVQRVKLVLR